MAVRVRRARPERETARGQRVGAKRPNGDRVSRGARLFLAPRPMVRGPLVWVLSLPRAMPHTGGRERGGSRPMCQAVLDNIIMCGARRTKVRHGALRLTTSTDRAGRCTAPTKAASLEFQRSRALDHLHRAAMRRAFLAVAAGFQLSISAPRITPSESKRTTITYCVSHSPTV